MQNIIKKKKNKKNLRNKNYNTPHEITNYNSSDANISYYDITYIVRTDGTYESQHINSQYFYKN